MKKFIHFLICALLASGMSFAQDAHLSHYFNLPVFTNPALAGNNIQNMRIALDYRSQNTGATSFKTQTVALDKIVNRVGFGILFSKNSAGKDGFSRLNILGGLSYNLTLGVDKLHHLSAGLQVGMLQKSFDPNAMSFENQYSYDVGFDPNASNGETFANTKTTRPDINAGFHYSFAQNEKDVLLKPFAGISFSHINKPRESFIEEQNVNPVRTNVQFGMGIRCTDKVELKPMVLYMKQDNFKEINAGVLSEFSMPNSNVIKAGLFYRNKDAVVAYGGYQINKIFLGVSYDANASEYRGNSAIEVSLVYTPQGKKPDKKEAKSKKKTTPVIKKKMPEPKISAPEFYTVVPSVTTPAIKNSLINNEIIKPKNAYVASTLLPKNEKLAGDQPSPVVKEKLIVKELPVQKEIVAAVTPAQKNRELPSDEFSGHNFERLFTVVFKPNTSKFDVNNQFDALESAIDYMYKYPEAKVLLTGNTSTQEQNSKPALGMLRAESVKAYMTGKGLTNSRIKINNAADSKPYSIEVDGKTEQQNSRVDIYLIK